MRYTPVMRKKTSSPIREARLKCGLSQAKLGSRVGVGRATVCSWEKGRISPELARLPALERALAPHFGIRDYVLSVEAKAA